MLAREVTINLLDGNLHKSFDRETDTMHFVGLVTQHLFKHGTHPLTESDFRIALMIHNR